MECKNQQKCHWTSKKNNTKLINIFVTRVRIKITGAKYLEFPRIGHSITFFTLHLSNVFFSEGKIKYISRRYQKLHRYKKNNLERYKKYKKKWKILMKFKVPKFSHDVGVIFTSLHFLWQKGKRADHMQRFFSRTLFNFSI